jgi:hypothetical protein
VQGLALPEGVKKLNFSPASGGVKTGVQAIRKSLKTLDSGSPLSLGQASPE